MVVGDSNAEACEFRGVEVAAEPAWDEGVLRLEGGCTCGTHAGIIEVRSAGDGASRAARSGRSKLRGAAAAASGASVGTSAGSGCCGWRGARGVVSSKSGGCGIVGVWSASSAPSRSWLLDEWNVCTEFDEFVARGRPMGSSGSSSGMLRMFKEDTLFCWTIDSNAFISGSAFIADVRRIELSEGVLPAALVSDVCEIECGKCTVRRNVSACRSALSLEAPT